MRFSFVACVEISLFPSRPLVCVRVLQGPTVPAPFRLSQSNRPGRDAGGPSTPHSREETLSFRESLARIENKVCVCTRLYMCVFCLFFILVGVVVFFFCFVRLACRALVFERLGLSGRWVMGKSWVFLSIFFWCFPCCSGVGL